MAKQLNKLTDIELARHVQAGSNCHFEELLLRHERGIYNFILSRIGCAEDAEDLTLKVFLKAYNNIAKYNEKYSFTTWLYCIARRESASFYRASQPEMLAIDENSETEIPDPRSTFCGQEDIEDLWDLVRENVSGDQFSALWLRYREGMSLKDTAKAIGKSQTSVKVLLHRARKRLAGKLSKIMKTET